MGLYSFFVRLFSIFSIFSENGTLKKQLNDERSKMQSKILTLEEENEKLTKENKNKKLASQQNKVKYHFGLTYGRIPGSLPVTMQYLGNE